MTISSANYVDDSRTVIRVVYENGDAFFGRASETNRLYREVVVQGIEIADQE